MSAASHFARNRAARAAADRQLDAEIGQPVAAHIEALRGYLNLVPVGTLVGFLASGIDARMLLAAQLADRGLNFAGQWVGFAEADRQFREAFANFQQVTA